MKIAIVGQQDFGKAVLEVFLARKDEVAAVFCAPEKPGARPDALRVLPALVHHFGEASFGRLGPSGSSTTCPGSGGCPGPSGLRILIGSSPERTGSSVREIPEVHS